MKIAIDTYPLESAHSARGMGFYTSRLISALEKESKRTKGFSLDAFEFRKNKDKLKGYDAIHYPYFDLFFNTLPFKKLVPTVVTVGDVIPLIYPKHYPPGVKGKARFLRQKLSLAKVDAVVTFSETSKKDIVRFLNIPSQKIFPIHLAPGNVFKKQSPKKLKEVKAKYNLPDKFVLYIGDVNWNKNLLGLVKAVKAAKLSLVIIGKQAVTKDYDKGHKENASLRELQEKYGADKDVLRLGFLETSELNAVLQLAAVYAQPSFYEGFGLPVLEAFGANIPVVASKTQALVEIAEDAALFFDPEDSSEIAKKMKSVVASRDLQNKLTKAGKERLKEYSWAKTAKSTMEVYKKVAKESE